jgi:hypothetical protein
MARLDMLVRTSRAAFAAQLKPSRRGCERPVHKWSARIAALIGTVVVALTSLPAPAQSDALDAAVEALLQETPYAEAREWLVGSGWMATAHDIATIPGRCSFREEICTTYPEAETCSGTGMGYCLFRFEGTNGRDLLITTAGEELADLVVVEWEMR